MAASMAPAAPVLTRRAPFGSRRGAEEREEREARERAATHIANHILSCNVLVVCVIDVGGRDGARLEDPRYIIKPYGFSAHQNRMSISTFLMSNAPFTDHTFTTFTPSTNHISQCAQLSQPA